MMCTADGSGCALAAPGGAFPSVADALRVGRALGAYLNSPAAAALQGPARGEALEALGAITSLLGAAHNGLLRRFDADYGHDADGYASSAAPNRTVLTDKMQLPLRNILLLAANAQKILASLAPENKATNFTVLCTAAEKPVWLAVICTT